jgi:DNA-binding GntR family transcriptional regulator
MSQHEFRDEALPDLHGYRTKTDWAYLQLRRWIQSGVLEAEQRLDQEELAARLGVSRVPLRQALVRLQAEGLVVARPHVGASVAPLSLADAEDIYASRGVLEPMLTKAAVPHLNAAILEEFERCIAEQQEALECGDRQRFLELDRQFHTRLYEPSGYPTSVELVQRLRDLSDRYVAVFQGDAARSRATIAEHREIVRACAAGDAIAAANLVSDHVRRGIEFLTEMSQRSPAERLITPQARRGVARTSI